MLEHAPFDHAPERAPIAPGVEVFGLLGVVELRLDVAVGAQEAREIELLGLLVAQDDLVAVEREPEPYLPQPAAEVEHPGRVSSAQPVDALDHLVVDPVHVRPLRIEAVELGVLVHDRVLPERKPRGLEKALLLDVIAKEPAPAGVRLVPGLPAEELDQL